MLTVLINAYAVSPIWGSESGMGWNWIVHLAKYCKLHIIAESEWKEAIEEACGKLPQANNLHFHYIPISEKGRKMASNQGDWRFYWYYSLWQKNVYAKAKEIIETEHIDIIHHLNMIGFREPGYLWKIKGVPYVWGPIGGMGSVCLSYMSGASFLMKSFFYLKNTLNFLQRIFHIRVHRAMRRANVLISATPDEQKWIKRIYGRDSVLISETGCTIVPIEKQDHTSEDFNIIWVGKFDFRKQAHLALRVMYHLKEYQNIKLHIYGPGTESQVRQFKKLHQELGLQDTVIWHGKVPHDKVLQEMQTYQLMLFTSISEATSTVIMEAIQNKVPVICFDACGMGAVVDESIGAKIKLTNPRQSEKDFAEAILYHYQHPEELKKKSAACGGKIAEFTWDSKAVKMVELYHEAIRKFKQKHPAKS